MSTTVAADPVQEFRAALAAAGIPTRDPIHADGQMHRVRIEGDRRGQRNGWYVLHGDDRPAGAFGCWKRGFSARWAAESDATYTAADREAWDRAQRAREAEQAALHQRTAQKAERLWTRATRADPAHPYLERKGIRPSGIRQLGSRLVVPIRDEHGNLHGLQFISRDGTKRYLTGTAKEGHYHSFGRPEGTVAICEGFATAATVREATGFAVVVAFDAGNIVSVAEKIRAKLPDDQIVVAADNDRETACTRHKMEGVATPLDPQGKRPDWCRCNPGLTAALKAANAVGARVAVPKFNPGGIGDGFTDWNDFAALYGLESVGERIRSAEIAGHNGTAGRMKFLSLSDLENLRDPEWLAELGIPAGGLVVVYGPPGAGKSFFVLGLVLSVAYGVPFYDHAVKQGPVLFIATEGHSGLKPRARAWKIANAAAGDAPAHFFPDVVNLLDAGAIATLITELQSLPEIPRLVVFDTFARSIPGGNENDARDVGLAVTHADRIRKETGATVLFVHHTSKAGEVERGSTALRGAADTMIQVKADDGVVSVICDKQKEAEPFPKLALRLQLVGESCVLSTITGAENGTGELGKNDRAALEALSKGFLAEGASTTAWMEASELKTATFYRARTSLVNKGYVDHDGKKYTVSELGRAALTINSHGTIKLLSDSGAALLSSYHAPLGVIVDDSKAGDVELDRAAGWEDF